MRTPAPPAPQVLLFTDKPEAPGVLRALSANFKPYKMAFGMVPSSDDTLMKQFNVQKVGGDGIRVWLWWWGRVG